MAGDSCLFEVRGIHSVTILMGCQLYTCRGASRGTVNLYSNVGVGIVFAERSCAASGVYLSSMAVQVQFLCVRESLLSTQVLLALALFQLSSHSLLDCESLVHLYSTQ